VNSTPRLIACLLFVLAVPAALGAGEIRASERECYAIGYDLGRQTLEGLEGDGLEVDVESLVRGFEAAVREQAGTLDEAELEAVLVEVHRRVSERQVRDRLESDPVYRALADQNHQRGRAFRERFAAREGVKRLDGGVLYEVVESGEGERVDPEGAARLSFEARFIDGTVFGEDRSRSLRVASTLAGGRIALEKMRVGDRWVLVLPPEQAFGLAGRDPDVGPNETIIVDVEVLGIEE